jgi:thiamine kinase-like enzyme
MQQSYEPGVLEKEICAALIKHSLISAEQLCRGVTIGRRPGRHAVFAVTGPSFPQYFAKVGSGSHPGSVRFEADVYRALAQDPDLISCLPGLALSATIVSGLSLLVVEAVPGKPLDSFRPADQTKSFSPAAYLGSILAKVHTSPVRGPAPLASRPSILSDSFLSLDLQIRNSLSAAAVEAVEIARTFPEFYVLLNGLRAEWCESALTHGDVKRINYIVSYQADETDPVSAGAVLIDWELGGIGDPAWDVGSVIADCLLQSLDRLELNAKGDAILGNHEKTQTVISEFWESYIAEMSISGVEATLLRATRYSAARLFQTTVERAQLASSLSQEDIYALQMSWNILANPLEAIRSLFGMI